MASINWIGILQPTDPQLPAQPGGCAQCHPGLGKKPNPVDQLSQQDLDNVDCLICHAPGYSRTVASDGAGGFKLVPAAGVDVLQAAKQAQSPTSAMCQRCHLGTGGGPNAKHGDSPTSAAVDVHVAAGKQCIDCHTTQDHKIAGAADLRINELPDVVVTCTNCHAGVIHEGEYAAINNHLDRIACQTCHIPAIARDPAYPTHTVRDWTTATPPLLPTGLYGPYNQRQNNVIPVYKWWNRMLDAPPGPLGDINDANAKIMPWKEWLVTAPRDAASKVPIPIKAGTFSITGNITAAVNKGVQDSAFPYSGQWEPFSETVYFSNNHQVAPPEQALKCDECHKVDGRLSFADLGYPEDLVAQLEAGPYRLKMPLIVNP